jgi:hypothetical protein
VRSRSQHLLTDIAVEYAVHQLLTRAGADSTTLPVSIYYGTNWILGHGKQIIVQPCNNDAWASLLELAPDTLDWLHGSAMVPSEAGLSFDRPMPVLFWGAGYEDGHRPFAELRSDGSVVFYADIIASTFFMLSRWEEMVVPTRDEHDRFPATSSVAYKQGFLDRPIVDEYALILREWLKVLLPSWEPKRRQFSVKLSHDIDQIRRFPNWQAAARTFGRDLIRRRDLAGAWQTGVETVTQLADRKQMRGIQGIHCLTEVSRVSGLGNDAFYFMAAEPAPFDTGYDPASPAVRQCIAELQAQGFEIGFHPGYHTFNNPGQLAAEKARLDAILGDNQYGGRQHYLRFEVPYTWRHWEQLGLAYDSTMGYADHEGFRCGTCHPFQPFDTKENRELDLWEWPLIVMDGTLKQYREMTPRQGEMRILELAQRCRQVEGTFTLLWHNSSLGNEWSEWAKTYQAVIAALRRSSPY